MNLSKTDSRMVLDQDGINISKKIGDLNEQLADIATVEINLVREGLKFDGTDQSSNWQAIIDRYPNQDLAFKLPFGKTIKAKNLIIASKVILQGNNCKIIGDTSADYLFVNKTNTSATLVVGNIELDKLSLVNFTLDTTVNNNVGSKLMINNVRAIGNGQIGDLIKVQSTDFLSVKNIFSASYNSIIKVIKGNSRMNTQLHLENINGSYLNYGMDINGVDKLTIDGFDINQCKSGAVFRLYVMRASIRNFHVEGHGLYPNTANEDGYGLYIANPDFTLDTKISEGDITLPLANARGGIYNVPATVISPNINRTTFENIDVPPYDTPTGYKALTLNGNYRWIGTWQYARKDVVISSTNNKILGGVILPTDNYVTGRNVLPVNKISLLTDFTLKEGGSGDATLTIVNGDTVITNNSGADLLYGFLITHNKVGWHTFLFNGDLVDTANVVSMQQNGSPYDTLFSTFATSYYSMATNRLCYYVPDAAIQYKLIFKVANGKQIKLGDMGLYKGFKTEY